MTRIFPDSPILGQISIENSESFI